MWYKDGFKENTVWKRLQGLRGITEDDMSGHYRAVLRVVLEGTRDDLESTDEGRYKVVYVLRL